jgi:hypothetical protein
MTSPNLCTVASPELLSMWFGWTVELRSAEPLACTYSGLPMGELVVSSGTDGDAVQISVRAQDGYTDPELAAFLRDTLSASASTSAEIEQRIVGVHGLADEHQTRCGFFLSAGAGRVAVFGVPEAEHNLGREWPTYGWVRLVFGEGLPGDVCSDLDDENSPARIDAEWPVRVDQLEFVGPPDGTCGPATLVVHGGVAVAPDGREVALPPALELTNAQLGVVAPFECQLR